MASSEHHCEQAEAVGNALIKLHTHTHISVFHLFISALYPTYNSTHPFLALLVLTSSHPHHPARSPFSHLCDCYRFHLDDGCVCGHQHSQMAPVKDNIWHV